MIRVRCGQQFADGPSRDMEAARLAAGLMRGRATTEHNLAKAFYQARKRFRNPSAELDALRSQHISTTRTGHRNASCASNEDGSSGRYNEQ